MNIVIYNKECVTGVNVRFNTRLNLPASVVHNAIHGISNVHLDICKYRLKRV